MKERREKEREKRESRPSVAMCDCTSLFQAASTSLVKHARVVSSSSDGSFRRLRSILFLSERLFGRFPLFEPAHHKTRIIGCCSFPLPASAAPQGDARENDSQSAVGILFWIPRPPQAQIDFLDPCFLDRVLLPFLDHALDLVQHASKLVPFELFRSNLVTASAVLCWWWCVATVGRGAPFRRRW